MTFTFSNPIEVDENGSVSVDCLVLDAEGNPTQGFQCYIEGASVFQDAQTAAAAWVTTNSGAVAPYVAPTLAILKSNSKAQILDILSRLVERVTSKYLPTDRLRWKEKETEAKAFTAIASESQTLADAATIAPGFVMAHSEKTDTEILVLVREEMTEILINATKFRGIDDFTSSARISAYPLIEAATDTETLLQIVADVDTSTQQFIAANNL